MKKPLAFALRGAAGFSMTAAVNFICVAIIAGAARDTYVSLSLGFIVFMLALLGGAGGAYVLFHETHHWLRATVGFGISIIFIMIASIYAFIGVWAFLESEHGGSSVSGMRPGSFESGRFFLVACTVGFALFGGVGGCFKSPILALPGGFAFGLPGLLCITMWHVVPHWLFMWIAPVSSLPIGGALFGAAAGWLEPDKPDTPETSG